MTCKYAHFAKRCGGILARTLLPALLAATCRPLPPQVASAPPERTSVLHSPAKLVTDRFVVPEDLEVTLWAETPMLFNPTNLDVDARGRVWVTEAVNYRTFKQGRVPRSGGDRVVILEDRDGNGAADTATVFVQDT
ncbi:MAG: hypothetical protein ABIP93_18430, partial [Gemmatimonadaceae bacterium]